MRVAAAIAVAVFLGACATGAGDERINVDDVKATAPAAALDQVTLCKSTLAEVKALLGEPYREGAEHGLKVRTWKLAPDHRKAEPAALAFLDDVVVDVCFDLPGIVRCELDDRCGDNAPSDEQPARTARLSL